MSEERKARTLLQAAATPMTPIDVAEFAQLIEDQREKGTMLVTRWSPATGVCIVGVAEDGKLLDWRMFPADSKDLAREGAKDLYLAVLKGGVDALKREATAMKALLEQSAAAKSTALQAIEKARNR